MTKYLVFMLVCFLAISCNSDKATTPKEDTNTTPTTANTTPQEATTTDVPTTNESAKTESVPNFTLEMSYNPKAAALINSGGEDLVIQVEIAGDPLDATAAAGKPYFNEEEQRVIVLSKEVRLNKAVETWTIDEVVDKEILKQLKDSDYEVTLNFYSGRRSSENNLFNGSFVVNGTISELKGTTTKVNIDMI